MAKILIADDDLEIQELLKFTFENEGYNVIIASDGEEAIMSAIENKPDLVILDVNMPKLSGFEVCEKIRENSSICLTPVMMLTSLNKIKDKITGIKLGADEYLGKPFDSFELLARVEGLLRRVKESISASPLTALPGNISIESEIKRRLGEKSFGLLYIDADNFKAFNDKYGFEKGDKVIKLISVIIRSAVAELGNNSDFIGHIGGDDFVIVTSEDKIQNIAKRILRDFESLIPVEYDEAARNSGFIEGVDRNNNKSKFPIMSLSIGALSVNSQLYKHYSQVVENVKDLLKSAKKESGNTLQSA